MSSIKIVFGERLKELRNENKKTLRELAENLKIPYSTLANYERGEREPSYENLVTIADFFGVTTDYLIGRSDFRAWEEEQIIKNYYEKYDLINNPMFKFILSSYKNLDKEKEFLYSLNNFILTTIEPLNKEFINFIVLFILPEVIEEKDFVNEKFNKFIFKLKDLFLNINALSKIESKKIEYFLNTKVLLTENNYIENFIKTNEKDFNESPKEFLDFLLDSHLIIKHISKFLSEKILNDLPFVMESLNDIFKSFHDNLYQNDIAALNYSIDIVSKIKEDNFNKSSND